MAVRYRNAGPDRIGTIALWAFVALVTLLYIGNLAGPPPQSARAIAVVGLVGWCSRCGGRGLMGGGA